MLSTRGIKVLLIVMALTGFASISCGKGKTTDANGKLPTDEASIIHTPFYNFDQLPVTRANAAPESGGSLVYDPAGLEGFAGWRSTNLYNDKSTYNFFKLYSPYYNTEHMGFEVYGFLEVDNVRKVAGNSLRYVVTGGKNTSSCPAGPGPNCFGNGLPLFNKQEYLNYLAVSKNPVADTLPALPVGNPYIYFMNSSDSNSPVHFREAAGANRLSLYMWVPDTLTVGPGGYDVPPWATFSFGLFSNVPKNVVFPGSTDSSRMDGHWYHEYPINGGGWIKFYIDTHPQHNNSFSNEASFPFPSRGLRNIGDHYFNNMFRLYLTTNRYSGFSVPMFSVWIDEMEFLRDNEPQNEETINSISVTYNPQRNNFEVGLSDKYTSSEGLACATYELRYSFRQITNTNWSEATPVHILKHDGFKIADSLSGRFGKNNNYYNRVWTSFKLLDADHKSLHIGSKMYFAIKDVSQAGGTGVDPVAPGKGREYQKFSNRFDYEGDRPALPLIKRFDYTVVESLQSP